MPNEPENAPAAIGPSQPPARGLEADLRSIRALQGAPLEGCGDDDCDDAYGAFEQWWDFDAQVTQVVDLPADESLKEKLREAFAAGFKARQELDGGEA